MARLSDKDRVGAWDRRVISNSKNDYEPWEAEYSCDKLEEYYYGKQHEEQSAEWSQRKYVINLFYASVNISKPSLLFNIPKYVVTARPSRLDDPLSDVTARAKLQEHTLQTEVEKPELGFPIETGLGILDAQSRFGVVQIGYTADFIDNPNAGKPMLVDGQEQLDSNGDPIQQPQAIPAKESLYIEWIPARQWRVGGTKNRLAANDWCGYYKWVDIYDIQQNPRYKNTSGLKATGRVKGIGKDEGQKNQDDQQHAGKIKVWFVWDMRERKRYVFEQGGEKFFLEEKYPFLPFATLKFNERLGHWLPLPETYNWVHPQNELNDIRETQRLHRKRAKRRYTRRPNVTPEEFAKLEDGEDMVCIETPTADSITPVPDAPLDQNVQITLQVSHEDFTRVSGISGESQQVAQSETATQANLIAVMGQTRESSKRLVVAQWLSEIGRIMLLTMREYMALPRWIKIAVDPESPLAAQETAEVKQLWKQISAEDLGDINNDIRVDLVSLSPVAREQEKTNWLTFLQIATNPTIGLLLSQSPSLLRKTAGLFDISSEKDIRDVGQAMEMVAQMFAQAQAAKAGVPLPTAPAPGPTPTNQGIQQQLMQQVPQGLQ